jgi:6-pyruvoyltetrahydropterin/6-carboxytetrahydropterin synthase
MIIGRKFEFHAAHRLNNPNISDKENKETYGACNGIHGHTWKFLVEVEGEPNKYGWLMNFSELKKIVNEKVINKLDHQMINNIVHIPTAENLAIWIWDQIASEIASKGCALRKVKIYETDNSYAKYYGK